MNNFVLSGALRQFDRKIHMENPSIKKHYVLGYAAHLPVFIRVTYLQAQVL